MPAILSAHDLNLWYGAHQALHNISIDIPEKSITALIGPSGCGKSTFLKTLNRMNDLVSGVKITGEVTYEGENIYDPSVDVNELRKQHRHGLPEAEPLPHEHLRQHRLRPENARHPQQGKARRHRGKIPARRGHLGRGERPAQEKRARPLRRPAAEALHRAGACRRAEGASDGRADKRARPHLHLQD